MHVSQAAGYFAPAAWQTGLAAFVTRRAQVVLAIQQQTQQLQALSLPELRALAMSSLETLHAEHDALTDRIEELAAPHLTPAWQSIKGVGPIVQVTMLSQLPELGSRSRQQIAKLVGVAPTQPRQLNAQGTTRYFSRAPGRTHRPLHGSHGGAAMAASVQGVLQSP